MEKIDHGNLFPPVGIPVHFQKIVPVYQDRAGFGSGGGYMDVWQNEHRGCAGASIGGRDR